MTGVEEVARRMFGAGEPWWADAVIGALMQRGGPLAYGWVERCARRLLPLAETEHRQQLLADLESLAALRGRGAGRQEFWRWSEEIWYRPGRDAAQTAMAKLVWAAGCEVGPRPESWRLHVRAPVGLLVDCSPSPREAVEVCLMEYRRVCEASGGEDAAHKPIAP